MASLDVGPDLLGSVASGSADAFGAAVDQYRRELLVHCYRMLGSIDDAEDAVQEALVRAWRGRSTFVRAVSLKAWLYRIATTVCLDVLAHRGAGRAIETSLGVGPVPDALLIGDWAGPEARYAVRESVSLAFLTALQVLPPRQRAVLILRDVLSWRAAEVADLLDLSVAAVNSALQRARATVGSRYGPARGAAFAVKADSAGQRSLLERYVRAWEASDIPALVALLREDAVLRMPPRPTVVGAGAIGAFLAAEILVDGRATRLIATSANGEPAFVVRPRPDGATAFDAFAVLLLATDGRRIGRIDAVTDPRVLRRFAALPGSAG